MDKEKIRNGLKNNFLKTLIFRVDFSGMMDVDVEDFIKVIRPQLINAGYITLQEEYGISDNILNLDNIQTNNETAKVYVFNSSTGKQIKISKTFTFQTQFFSTIEKIDTTDKILNIRENIQKQRNNNVKEYGESIIQYLRNIMQEENLYVRKNYLIITSTETFEKAVVELKEFYDDLKYSFASIKVTVRLLDDMDIVELLYRELNKNANENLRNIIKEGGLKFYVEAKNKT